MILGGPQVNCKYDIKLTMHHILDGMGVCTLHTAMH